MCGCDDSWVRLAGWEQGSQLAQALPDPSTSRFPLPSRPSRPGQAPGSSPQGPGLNWGDTEGPRLETGPGGAAFFAEVSASPGESGLPGSALTLKPRGCPGLTAWGWVVSSQIRAVWSGKGEWARVQRRFALILLSPSFPGPLVSPIPQWGGPSNADQDSCVAANRIRCRDYGSSVSPLWWPFSMTPAPLRDSLWAGEGDHPPAHCGQPLPCPPSPCWAQPQHLRAGPSSGAHKSPPVFGHQEPCSAPGREMWLCHGSLPGAGGWGLKEGDPSRPGGAPALGIQPLVLPTSWSMGPAELWAGWQWLGHKAGGCRRGDEDVSWAAEVGSHH